MGGTGDEVDPPFIFVCLFLYSVFFRANRKKRVTLNPSSKQHLCSHQASQTPMVQKVIRTISMPVRTREAGLTLKKVKVGCSEYE